MRIRLAVPDEHLSPEILNAALEAVTRTDEALLRDGKVPLIHEPINSGKVRWKAEPAGQDEHFDTADTVLKRGHGDCDDLAPWRAASLRISGHDPDAIAVATRSGPGKWHAWVQRGDGRKDDPSIFAGMGKGKLKIGEGTVPLNHLMTSPGGIALATLPITTEHTAARVDLPWQDANESISGHGVDKHPRKAVAKALRAAICCGMESGAVHPSDLSSALALEEAVVHGYDRDIRARLEAMGLDGEAGAHAVGSLWGSIKKAAGGLAHVVPLKSLASIVTSPLKLAQTEAKTALKVAAAIATMHPAAAARAAKDGLHELMTNPAWQTIQHGASLFPGAGTIISSGMATAAALGQGLSLKDAAIAAARSAIPPGPAQTAFDLANGMVHGQSLSSAALIAARQQLPPEARAGFDAGLHVAHKASPGVPNVMGRMIVRL